MINNQQQTKQLNQTSPIKYVQQYIGGGNTVVLPKKCPYCGSRGVRTRTEGTKPVTFLWCYTCGWKG